MYSTYVCKLDNFALVSVYHCFDTPGDGALAVPQLSGATPSEDAPAVQGDDAPALSRCDNLAIITNGEIPNGDAMAIPSDAASCGPRR